MAILASLLGLQHQAPASALTPTGTWTRMAWGIGQPRGIVAGPDGNMWFTDGTNDSIDRVAPDGAITSFHDPQVWGLGAITVGPDGNLWFAYAQGLARITPAGEITPHYAGSADGVVAGPDGRLWFLRPGFKTVSAMTVGGVLSSYPISDVSFPGTLIAGPDGNLWFSNTNGNAIERMTTAGVRLTSFTDPAIQFPRSIVLGPDGNVWFTTGSSKPSTIVRLTAAGGVTSFSYPGYGMANLTTGTDGNLWFTALYASSGTAAIGRLTTAGVVTPFDAPDVPSALGFAPDGELWAGIPHGLAVLNTDGATTAVQRDGRVSGPEGITTGPDGALWFTNNRSSSIGRMTPAGAITTFTGDGVVQHPHDVITGPDGALWFTNEASIGRSTTAGEITSYTAPSVSEPVGITVGPDGNLWFTDIGTNSIGRITPTGTISMFTHPSVDHPLAITTGADGNLWFTNATNQAFGTGSIGRITPAGTITAFAGGAPRHPAGITAGPDGNVWFTSIDKIGRITPAGVTTLFTGTNAQNQPAYFNAVDILAGPDGFLWFTGSSPTTVGRVATNGTMYLAQGNTSAVSLPAGITFGTDGDVWLTNATEDAIWRFGAFIGQPLTGIVATNGGYGSVQFTLPGPSGPTPLTGSATVTPYIDGVAQPPLPYLDRVTGLTLGQTYTFTVRLESSLGPSVTSPMTPPLTVTRFIDVGTDAPFYGDIEWLAAEGIATGFPNGAFYPTVPVSRQALAAFLFRFSPATVKPPCDSAPFPDVPVGAPFCSEIRWMVEQGLASGYADGGFHPAATVSRQAMAAFLYRYAGAPLGATPTCAAAAFPDVPATAPFCGEITWLVGQGVVNGYADGTFKPTAGVSRQATAAFLHRLDAVLHP